MINNNGHRARLRNKFLKTGFKGFLDYEVIDLLLTFGTPRRDCKQVAKELLTKYKTLKKIFNLTSDELQQTNGIGPSNLVCIKLYSELKNLLSEQNLESKKSLKSTTEIVEYLQNKIGNKKKEHFVILCLDSRNNLIYDEVSIGTLNASLVHPRELFSKAILNHANQIIVAHNHPSGDFNPSNEDSVTTKRLVNAGKLIGISIIDHIIVSNSNYYSFKENNLI